MCAAMVHDPEDKSGRDLQDQPDCPQQQVNPPHSVNLKRNTKVVWDGWLSVLIYTWLIG